MSARASIKSPVEAPAALAALRPDVAVSLRAVSKVYGRNGTAVRALNAVSIGFLRGSFTAVMGPSGSGESALLHCAAGLDRPTTGAVWLAGRDLARLSETDLTKIRRSRVGFVFQAFNLVSALTVRENIALPSRLARARQDRRWLTEVVARVGLGERLLAPAGAAVGGEQQRVAIARALAVRPGGDLLRRADRGAGHPHRGRGDDAVTADRGRRRADRRDGDP